MPIPWGQHLDLARCAASIGELDLGAGAVAMAYMAIAISKGLTPWKVGRSETVSVW